MLRDKKLYKFVKQRSILFWSTNNYANLSDNTIVENIINYGDFDDVQKMIDIMGIKKVAKIFNKKSGQKRNNFRPEINNYFKLFFKKYA